MTFLLGILARYWMQLALIGVGVALWWYADDGWCNGACRTQRARADNAESQIAAARQRATDLALLATDRLTEIDAAVKRQKDTDATTFHALADRAHALPAAPTVRLSFDAVRLWRDSAGTANDPGPAAVSAKPAPAVPQPAESEAAAGGGGGDLWYSEQDVIGFTVDAAQAYRSCVAKWRGAVSAYDSVRNTLQEAP